LTVSPTQLRNWKMKLKEIKSRPIKLIVNYEVKR
jgi:hypothetical protein